MSEDQTKDKLIEFISILLKKKILITEFSKDASSEIKGVQFKLNKKFHEEGRLPVSEDFFAKVANQEGHGVDENK